MVLVSEEGFYFDLSIAHAPDRRGRVEERETATKCVRPLASGEVCLCHQETVSNCRLAHGFSVTIERGCTGEGVDGRHDVTKTVAAQQEGRSRIV
jgi:hypothetical protein